MRPDRTAVSTAWYAVGRSGGMRSRSAPARIARTATSASPYRLRTPAMSSASVTTTPSYPSSPRSRPVITARESVAGSPEGSSLGMATCAVMIASTPRSIAARNGGASTRRHRALEYVMTGRSWWLSTLVPPCPGKCLATEATPAAWNPSTAARTMAETSFGSDP